MNPAILYAIIGLTVFVAWAAGRSLDQRHSNERVTWSTGVIGRKTVYQSIILGLVAGPIVYFIKGGSEALWFCIMCMMAAPFIVDMLRPTVTFHNNAPPPAVAATVNKLNFVAVAVGVVLLAGLIAFSAGAISIPTPQPGVCQTCQE